MEKPIPNTFWGFKIEKSKSVLKLWEGVPWCRCCRGASGTLARSCITGQAGLANPVAGSDPDPIMRGEDASGEGRPAEGAASPRCI